MSKDKDFQPGHGYERSDWDEVSDNPEWSAADIASAMPLAEASPDLHAAIIDSLRKRGEVPAETAISLRLDMDVFQKLRATGPGWQSRANDALREFVEKTA